MSTKEVPIEKSSSWFNKCVTVIVLAVIVGYAIILNDKNILLEKSMNEYRNELKDVKEEVEYLRKEKQSMETKIAGLTLNLKDELRRFDDLTNDLYGKLLSKFNETSKEKKATDLPRECAVVRTNGRSGVYTIYPYGRPQPAVPVYCQTDTTGHVWTVIQRRFNGAVNFYRNWEAYKHGFGQPDGEYWLGNDIIHVLTSDANHALMINMTDFSGISKFAEYLSFHVSSEENLYSLMVSKYDGNAGDSFTLHNGQKFSTFDRDNDSSPDNCATMFKGAWWYAKCHSSNLNGMYLKGQHAEFATGVNWNAWRGYHYSLQSTEMMIRKY